MRACARACVCVAKVVACPTDASCLCCCIFAEASLSQCLYIRIGLVSIHEITCTRFQDMIVKYLNVFVYWWMEAVDRMCACVAAKMFPTAPHAP